MARQGDFSAKTRRLLANRVGSKCSLPGCRIPTVGPGPTRDSIISSGEAAHIFSALPAGPRGQGGLTVEQLRDPTNGLWCCTRHAAFIDASSGNGFDAETLRSYRELAEARAAVERDGIAAPGAGWFHELRVRAAPTFAGPVTLRFGKSTVVIGANSSGKTVLADMLAGIARPERWSRWRSRTLRDVLDFEIRYFDPTPQVVSGRISATEVVRATNGVPDAAIPRPVGVVRYSLNSQEWPRGTETPSDEDDSLGGSGLTEFAGAVGEDREAIRGTVTGLRSPGIHGVRTVGEAGLQAWLPHTPGEARSGPDRYFPWSTLSSTQRLRLGLELAVAVASQRARDQPTLLIVDDLGYVFDDTWSRYVYDLLAQPGLPFQVVLLALYPPPDDLASRWVQAKLIGRAPAATLEQPLPSV